MKKKMFTTVQFSIKREFYPADGYDPPEVVPVPVGWHERVMAAIRRLGPLRKHSWRVARHSSMNDEKTDDNI